MAFNSELDRVSKIYVLNEVFDIKIHNDMSTISKLHLGRNPETGTVNWEETNAGFGHILLLLNYLLVKNKLEIPNITFEPMGNLSSIKVSQKDMPPKECKLVGPPTDEVGLT